jgi:chorismate mutase
MQAPAVLCRTVLNGLFLVGILVQATNVWAEEEPLHVQIDKLLVPTGGVAPATASDAEFLRRASLDLTGMPPTADEARAFIVDKAPDKRTKLVDQLFASPHFVRNFATALDLMLMERRPNTNISADEWQAWLLKSVRENKPWSVLAKEIIEADGADPAKRPAARFALDRNTDPNMLTRDVGRVFFGRDMQCAQCHDHPLVNDYLQSDYQGLLAFLQPTFATTIKQGDKSTLLQAEHAGSQISFQSVFVHLPRRTVARVPDDVMIDEPFYLPGDEYQVAPADNVKSVPKFSYRSKLAELATNGSNDAFNRNIANRLWALMFGRGLVHPPDMQNPDNPPSNPELLELLAKKIAAMKFDMRAFLREIALSNAYQRAFDPPADLASVADKAAKEAKLLQEARVALAKTADASAEAYKKATNAWEEIEAKSLPIAGELDTAKTKYADAKKKADEATKAAADATSQLNAKKTVMAPVQNAATAAQEAVKALPSDKELSDAAQKFIARAKQLATETETLTKTAKEKTAAVAPMNEAWNKTKPPVETARQKITPITTSLKEAEKAMLAARDKSAHDKEILQSLDRRLATAQKVAKIHEMNRALADANQAVPAREAALRSAEQLLAQYVPIAGERDKLAKTASEVAAAATKAYESARAPLRKQSEAIASIAAAIKAADAAHLKLPENAALADVVKKLQESSNEASAKLSEMQKVLAPAEAARKATNDKFVTAQEALAATLAERAHREQAVAAAKAAVAAAKADVVAKKSELEKTTSELNDGWAKDFTIASLKPLTPEQMCWTVFQVTGVYDRYWKKEVADLDKAKPLRDAEKKDPKKLEARNIELEQRTYDKLKSNIGTFVAFYGAAAGQPQGDFFATADQALFVANAGSINSWIVPASDNVTERIVKQQDFRAAAEDLYLNVLTRMPTDAERADVEKYLKDRTKDKPVAAQELVWALLNSAEFRFNH